MTQSPMTLARLLAIAGCAAYPLATAACARPRAAAQSTPQPAPEVRVPVTLRVTNSNWSDARIYLVRGAMWGRLRIVTTNSTLEFSIPGGFVTPPPTTPPRAHPTPPPPPATPPPPP